MLSLLKSKLHSSLVLSRHPLLSLYSTTTSPQQSSPHFHELCHLVTSVLGGLDELEASLDRLKPTMTSTLVTQVIDSCKTEAPTRRVLRFFSWARKYPHCQVGNKAFNHAIRVFAKKKDITALNILIEDFQKESRVMESETFSVVAEMLVKMGRENQALGIFKNLDKFKCGQDRIVVTSIVQALCAKGHAKKAEDVVWQHRKMIYGVEDYAYKSLLYGWCFNGDVKEARRVLTEMTLLNVSPDLFCYNTFLRCICKRNLKHNLFALVSEASDVMMEMRSKGIHPNAYSYNILLSCLGRARRVKEACGILNSMRSSGCSPDWVSYYLVVRVLYLSGRFGRGNEIVDEMIENGLMHEPRFYYDLIGVLCGVERVDHAFRLFELMKKRCMGDYGPVYDLLIPRLCREGELEKGRQLWDEAIGRGIALQCSSDTLNLPIKEISKPRKNVEEVET
ncbi:hypothetical protein GIB67_033086 [Kingdonia uniflora]|uniref:Pentatricopeptide repeat-containing protein n=1 Tax=Kingdonia uniflora TaxID=39325 RepID=A0A7J7MZ09_9MAGN|nr:hypothetical protein GIB67_033086 [Kingdonia uniflora]